MEQITLLMGPNSYALRKEKNRWIQQFRKRQGEESLARYDAKKISFKDLHAECQVAPFLAEKRLVVVDGVPSRAKKEDVQALESVLHADTLLLFVLQTELGKKPKLNAATKALMEVAAVQEFPQLSASQLQQWVEDLVAVHGASGVDLDAKKLLIAQVGDDQNLLESEVIKLSIYAHGRSITLEDAQVLMACTSEREVWKLLDFLGAGNVEGAMQYSYDLLDRGYSPQALWSTFLWMIALLTQIVAIVEEGETNPWTIAGTVRANPFSVKAIIPFAKSLDRDKLRHITTTALQADAGLKTGTYKATAEAPEELLALIDRSLLSFSS